MNKLYNKSTKLKYKTLRRPLYMKAVFDNKVKHPRLTVIFLHGISAISETWHRTFDDCSKDPSLSAVRLIALDLLGFGTSSRADWLDYDYLDYHHALENSIEKYHITSPVILIGHSMGSLIMADYTVNFEPSVQVVAMVLTSPPVLMAREAARIPDELYTNAYGGLQDFAKNVPAADVIAAIIERTSTFRKKYLTTVAFRKSMENIILNPHNYHTFTKIRVPTMLLHGHFDPLVIGANLKRVAAVNPCCEYRSVIGHHDVSVGKRAKIISVIKRELKNV